MTSWAYNLLTTIYKNRVEQSMKLELTLSHIWDYCIIISVVNFTLIFRLCWLPSWLLQEARSISTQCFGPKSRPKVKSHHHFDAAHTRPQSWTRKIWIVDEIHQALLSLTSRYFVCISLVKGVKFPHLCNCPPLLVFLPDYVWQNFDGLIYSQAWLSFNYLFIPRLRL